MGDKDGDDRCEPELQFDSAPSDDEPSPTRDQPSPLAKPSELDEGLPREQTEETRAESPESREAASREDSIQAGAASGDGQASLGLDSDAS